MMLGLEAHVRFDTSRSTSGPAENLHHVGQPGIQKLCLLPGCRPRRTNDRHWPIADRQLPSERSSKADVGNRAALGAFRPNVVKSRSNSRSRKRSVGRKLIISMTTIWPTDHNGFRACQASFQTAFRSSGHEWDFLREKRQARFTLRDCRLAGRNDVLSTPDSIHFRFCVGGGQLVFEPGRACPTFLMVWRGQVRVSLR